MNYYKLLQVTPTASADEIRKAFRKEAKKYHPDHYHGSDPKERERRQKHFILLTRAYDTLSDPKKRQAYEQQQRVRATPHQKATRNASSSSSNRQQQQRPQSQQRQQAQQRPTPPIQDVEEAMDELLQEIQQLLQPFDFLKNPLEQLLNWARQLFAEAEAEKPRPARPSFDSMMDELRRFERQASEQKKTADIEDELQKLKQQYGEK